MGYCQNCGAEVQPGAVKCAYCGAAFKPPVAPAVPPQSSYAGPTVPVMPLAEQRSKIAAGILGILLGAFGIHNFYLGYTGKAVAQLLLTVLTCGYGAFVTAIWGLVEGIMILTGSIKTDARGVPLKD